MKKINLFLATLFFSGYLFGYTTYYYDPQIKTNDAGKGLVYITRQDPPGMSSYSASQHYGTDTKPTSATSSELNDYTFWAYPAHGCKFDHWEKTSDTKNEITIKAQTGIGDEVWVKSSATDAKNRTKPVTTAIFVEDTTELQVILESPLKGTITATSTAYKVSSNTFVKIVPQDYATATTETSDTLIHYFSDKVTLSASSALFSGWWSVEGEKETLLSPDQVYEAEFSFNKNMTIRAKFSDANFKNGDEEFVDLKSALQAASEGTEKVVIMVRDYTLNENVTIPSGVTLIIPDSSGYGLYLTAPLSSHSFLGKIPGKTDEDRSSVYKKLTLAKGVQLTVNGTLYVGGFRWCASYIGNKGAYIPETTGNFRLDQTYGLIDMAANSTIIVNNLLCCWGRIRGDGTITANNGATVRECWVNTDYREADAYQIIADDLDCFPMNQYYIQDIQVATTFKAGAREILTAGMYFVKTDDPYTGEINWIGADGSAFVLNGNASITKRYDVATDRLIYDLYDGVALDTSALTINYNNKPYSFSMHHKVFDITNNCILNVRSGKTIIKTDIALAAGAELNIDADAEVELAEHVSLFVFDKDDWGNFACMKKIVPLFLPKYELSETGANYYATHGITPTDVYSGYATYKMLRTEDNLTDAKITVNGTLTVKGGTNNMDFHYMSGLYTTNAGAQISSENGGKIVFEQGVGTQKEVAQLWGAGRGEDDDAKQQMMVDVTPAKLFNGDGSYMETEAYTEGVVFNYTNGKWVVNKLIKEITIDETKTTIVEYDENSKEVTTEKQSSTYTIPSGSVVETTGIISIGNGSTLVVEENASINANTLALNTTPSYSDDDNNMGISSQITGDGTFTATNVYIDIKMDPEKLNASNYYAFAVPFNVSAQAGENGVQKLDKDGNVSNATIDVDYRAYYYDGATRAQNGSNGSAWVAVTSADTYQPGKFYLIEFASDKYNVYRFHKITDEKLDNTKDIDLNIYDNPISDGDNGWCGIANNSLQNTKLEIEGVEAVQVLNPTDNTFTPVMLADATFAVGTPMFAQVTGETSATHTSTQASPERRFAAQVEDKTYGHYTIRIAAEGATKKTDQMFISASENANDSYTVGKDLAKMFMGQASVAQLWINRYGKKLAMSQTNLIDDVAEASLTLYAPKAGKYQVYLKTVPEDATLYLLEDGAAVANLNDGACVVSLSKGENDQFGLRINAIKTIPGVVTSIDEAFVGKDLQKVLLDGVVYIVREGKLYNALGQQVK